MTAPPFEKCNPGHHHGVPKIFLSYSHEDRRRAEAVKMLLELGGAQVFMDWRSILPGSEWSAALERALADCDVLCVFWSAAAQRSTWVRAEYTTFIGRFPDRPCIPLCADETPLPLLLAKRQAPPEFLALASEMVALRRDLVARGVSRREIRRVVQGRIAQLGLQLDDAQRSKLLGLFVSGASLGMLLSWLARPVKATAILVSAASSVFLVTVVSLVWSLSGGEPDAERLDHAAHHAAPIEREHEPVRDGGPGSAEAPASADGSGAKQPAPQGSSGNGAAMSAPTSQGSGARVATALSARSSESRNASEVRERQVRRAVLDNADRLRRCYEDQLQVDPGLSGTVYARFVISERGVVVSSAATGLGDAVDYCIAGEIERIAFPPWLDGSSMVVNYSFYFRPARPLPGARGSPTVEIGTPTVLRPPIKPGGT